MINEIGPNKQYLPLQFQRNNLNEIASPKDETFADSLKELIQDVNSLQKDSNALTEKMIKGEPVDLHDVMIASEKAKTSFQLLLEIRNKFLDMYQEVHRMQV
ncbi:MAG: flagellar hook-basal body complex protein FliE [Ignavibacteria bacterium]|jgi:flagellar hook-basal body complex protein FliE|nr:flagellar hook-basal body complex protein FliE [Ignavibacteria bacterium]